MVSQISFVSVLALDEVVSAGTDQGEQVSLIDTLADKGIDPTWGLESQETRGLLAAAINLLSEREKIVVTLYYFEGLTLAEIGRSSASRSPACARSTRRPSAGSAASSPTSSDVPRFPRSDVTRLTARADPAPSVPSVRSWSCSASCSRSRPRAGARRGDWTWPVTGPVIRGFDPRTRRSVRASAASTSPPRWVRGARGGGRVGGVRGAVGGRLFVTIDHGAGSSPRIRS